MTQETSALPLLKFYLFGRPEVWRGSERLAPLATQKTQSLLAYLLIYRHQGHPRQKLAALFWGDWNEVRAHHSLSTALWRIRKQFGEAFLLSDVETVQINRLAPFWLDVAEFEQLLGQARGEQVDLDFPTVARMERAVELYRGDFLEGFYDDWCLDERYRLEAHYLNALRQLVDWYKRQGNAGAVLKYAQFYLGRDPLTEEVHLAAMRAYMQQGDAYGARRQWQRCCEARQHELQLPPSAEMSEQAKEILGVLYQPPQETEPLQLKVSLRPGNLERSPFVGRAAEMDLLVDLWRRAYQGHGRIVFLSGEAGIGKTRLVEEFASFIRWNGGFPTIGNCYEPERDLPLQPIREIVQTLAAEDLAAYQAIPEWERKELTRLLPELEPDLTKSELSSSYLQPEQQSILFQSIVAFLRHFVKRQPLLMVIEDLHWAADTTLAAFHFIARQVNSLPVLVIGTFRAEELEQAGKLEEMIAALVRNENARLIQLGRLSREAIEEMIQRMRLTEANPDWIEQFYAYTAGNAFYTLETLRACAETEQRQDVFPIAPNVQSLIKSRLRHLSPLAGSLLNCAAVAGQSFDFELVRIAGKLSEVQALEGFDELLRKGFLREGSSTVAADYEFVHQIVQAVVYHEIHHRRRRHLHCQVGEALENVGGDLSLQAASLAFHFDRGGNPQKALGYHHLAARRASAVFAWQEAEMHLNRALELLASLDPDISRQETADCYGKVLAERAEIHYLQGDLYKRDQDLNRLSELATRTRNQHLSLQTLMRQTCYLNLDACYEQAVAFAQEGISLAKNLIDPEAQGYLLSQLGFAHYFLGKPRFALQALEQALSLLPEDDCETRRHITHILGYVHFHLGNYLLALADQQQAYRDHQALGDFNGMVWAGLDMGAIYLQLGRLREAEQMIKDHLQIAQRMGALSVEAYGLNQVGGLELKLGNYQAAIAAFQRSLSLQESLRTEHGRIAAQLGIGFAYSHLGACAAARQWLEQAIATARQVGHQRRLAEALIGLGITETIKGQFEKAELCLCEAVQIARRSQSLGNLAAGLAALGRLERKKGDWKTALWYALEAVQISHQLQFVAVEMWGELELGLLYLAQGKAKKALDHTQRASELAACEDEGWIGREQVYQAQAMVLRALGREAEAREQICLAQEIIASKAALIADPDLRSSFLKKVKRRL
ncbi:MAG: Adenylate cyclase [Anaerolineae bacterium]|nr:MAG: Adenylate cyclase [Anaerolineae bacterium]